jgi:predicted RND superfamily exporter protein
MLQEAERIARACISNHPTDRYNYRALASVGRIFAQRYNDTALLVESIEMIRSAEANILDPDFVQERRDLESTLRRIESDTSEVSPVQEWEDSATLLADSA